MEQIKQVYIAISKENSYQIEFYEFIDEQYAIAFFNNNKEIFKRTAGNASSNAEINLKNYGKYALSTNGKYSSIIRTGNTAVYINVNDEYKENVKEIIKKIGY